MTTLVRQWNGPGHLVFDTGMQLLTACGRRVTWVGAELERGWAEADHLECFECLPSPALEWATTYGQEGGGEVDYDYGTQALYEAGQDEQELTRGEDELIKRLEQRPQDR